MHSTLLVTTTVLVLITLGVGTNLQSMDDYKKELIISQFKSKLKDHLSAYDLETVLVGASHGSKGDRKGPPRRHVPLSSVHKIKVLPKNSGRTVSKVIIPGFPVPESKTLYQFKLPALSPAMLKSARLVLYSPTSGLDVETWQVDLVNSTKKVMKNIRKTSNAKVRILFITDILGASLDNIKGELQLRLVGRTGANSVLDVKNLLLMVTFKDPPRRLRRSAVEEPAKMCTNTSIFCCMNSFTINPAEMSMLNLVSPEVIPLNYCRGECNDQSGIRTNHAMALQKLRNSKISSLTERQLDSIKSCCSPQTYSKLVVTFMDYTTQQLKSTEMNDMIVSSCSCF